MLSLEQKIGQMMVVGFHGLQPPDYLIEWLTAGRVGGVILFARNVASPKQVAELTQALHSAAARPLLIAIDQEGGSVARLRDGFTESPGAMALGAADSEVLAEEVAAVLATEMRSLGINWNLAPVVDITQNTENPSMGTRSLGSNTLRVSALAVAQVRGFQKIGVAATAKHFPGKGNTAIDPHVSLPVIDLPMERLLERDIAPFRAVIEAGISAILVTHAQFLALDSEYPSTLSQKVIQGLLRREIGFTGLVTTDCLEMKAILNHYSPSEAAVLAALAGASTLLFSHTREHQEEAYDALLSAVQAGRVPETLIDAALKRVTATKERYVVSEKPSTQEIRHPAHLVVVEEAARAAVATLRASLDTLPIEPDDPRSIALVEFTPTTSSEAIETGGQADLTKILRSQLPKVKAATLSNTPPPEQVNYALQLAASSDLLIVATRNAHLNPEQHELAQSLLRASRHSIALCLQNPYDVNLLSDADTILCTCGDSTPSLHAIVDVLMGYVIPTARLPVPIPVAI